ncbi:Major facilitator superfamily protein [Arabidopsis thaliana]|uniref:Major facilitator superfamily protein n=1 Tax=Arabidopsis thaliana TaxID=3702 RepID=A0A1P8AXI2_ARATH|nr:Major facilitator superfamily protein [Arabidopsis thaliana]ANM61368.1 Major facilitator superfamily protein [Arabidopsis thaliana]|eukprot:NP_001323589.1 Major facilitator superfamily protein [Arabidopsis thaliana]
MGFLGLSGAILIQLYHAVCGGEGNPATFILLLAIVPTLVMFLAMPFVRVYETVTISDKKHLDGLSAISMIIAAYLMVVITVENVLGLSRSMQIFSFILVLLLLASPLLVAVRALREKRQTLSSLDGPVLDTSALLDPPSSNIFPDGDHLVAEDSNILEAMSTVNFWLLFLAMLCGMGSGFATVNNMRQIGESLRYSSVQLNSLVSLWSIWNFLGRFGAGYVSDTFLHKHSWPRPIFMAITLGVMAIGHIIVASGVQGSLYAGSVLIGMAYGSQWSLMPTITSEIFGIRHMGTIYFTISIAGPIGSYILSVKVIGYFYDKVASEDDNSCFGSQCFRTSFMIMASVALFGSLVASVLFFRTHKFYKNLVAKRNLK